MKDIFKVSGLILLITTIIFFNSCKKDKPLPPTLTTTNVTGISYTSAISGGNITSNGGPTVASKGLCWSPTPDPTVSDNVTIELGGSDSFISNNTQLSPNTTYYLRAYATNTAGTGYGNQITFMTLADPAN